MAGMHDCKSHAITMLAMPPLTIFLTDILFIRHLQALEFQTQEPQTLDQELGSKPQGAYLTPKDPSCSRQFAMTTTMQAATAHIAVTSTDAIWSGAAPPGGNPDIDKALLWTPLQPFALECELHNHPNKAFVRRLINNLQQGCAIGYEGPHIAYFATNLQSASQQPKVINTTLNKE